MPLIRKPTTQELEDHFFGSGAFSYGWFILGYPADRERESFPVEVSEVSMDEWVLSTKEITEDMFIEGIKKYAESLDDRSFDDLIEDMDAGDVDNVIQLIMFDEIRYS